MAKHALQVKEVCWYVLRHAGVCSDMLVCAQTRWYVLRHSGMCSDTLVCAQTCPNLRFLLPAVAVHACGVLMVALAAALLQKRMLETYSRTRLL